MDYVYHGSKTHGIKRLEPRKSTHGVYVYATLDKVLATHFSGRCGDDLTYALGHFSNEKNGPWQLIELIPGALEKMYSNSSSIYTLPAKTFKDINTGFCEVVSEEGVDILKEEIVPSVYEALVNYEKEGLLEVYRYPNKPKGIDDDLDILNKWRYYKDKLHMDFNKNNFERLLYLHPELLDRLNEFLEEYNYDYRFKPHDLIDIFKSRIERQLIDLNYERYIDSSYISIINTYPELTNEIDLLYYEYKESLKESEMKK